MKSASQLFYLGIFALWGPLGHCQTEQDACVISPRAIVSDACASYSTLEKLNARVNPAVSDLTRTTDFFSYYRVNLFHKQCPFWDDENGMCGNIACAVQTLENEEDIPPVWRASELGKLEGPSATHPGKSTQKARPQKPLEGRLGEHVGESCVVEYDDESDDRDYCVREDESNGSKGDYVSLLQNPERFTGYAGDGAKQVWEAIYRENCFQKSSFPHSAQLGDDSSAVSLGGGGGGSGGSGLLAGSPAAQDLRSVLEAAGRQQVLAQQRQQDPNTPFVAKTGLEAEDECVEKRVFYRLISGMHASISTHLCWDFLNQTTGEWMPNTACYQERLEKFPERIGNLYFNYALVTRAVAKLSPHLAAYTFCSGDPEQDAATRAKVLAVTAAAASVPQIFDESLLFKNGEGPSLKEDFRNRFRNVSRLMDCVGCDKCRLWGKVQTAGYGAALKVLFEFDNEQAVPTLQRTELVSLFNTYARLSAALNAIQNFRLMVASSEDIVAASAAAATEAATRESPASGETISGGAPGIAVGSSGGAPGIAAGVGAGLSGGAAPIVHKIPDRARKPHNVVVHPPPPPAPTSSPQYPSVRESFNEEFGRVIHAFKIVLMRWVSMPGVLYNIITSELMRLWQFFIGLPVRPRIWKFERPNLDEL